MKFFLRVLISLGIILAGILISIELKSDFPGVTAVIISAFIMGLDSKKKDKAANTTAAPKKKHGAWLWVAGGVVCIALFPAIGPVIAVVLGLALAVWVFFATMSGTKKETEQYLERRRDEIAADRQMWEENQRKEQRRMAMRSEAEKLENQARFWEAKAAQTGNRADARKARDYRSMARDAWKKV